MAGNPVATINAQLALDSANFDSGLARAPAKARKAAKEIEGAFGSSLFGEGFGKALEKVFDSSKLKVLDEGAAQIRVFGSALEPLGPAGIAAAGAIAAVGFAAEQARKAMEWGDDLDRTAKTLGVTTTFLQEFDAASIATSVGLAQGRAGLTSFSETLGKFSSGLATAKQTKWFDALGFTREGAANTSNLKDELEKALTALAAVPNASQRAAFAKGLGMTELLPIVANGTAGIEEFLAAMDRAKDGHVVSPEEVARLAQLNDKVEELSHDISIDFKKAFVELAPTIETVAEFIERCARALSNFTSKIPDAVRGMGSIADFEKQISSLLGLQKGWEAARQAGQRPLAFDAADQQRKMNDPAHPVSQFVNQVLFTTPSDLFNSAARSGWAKGMAGRVGASLASGKADFSFENSLVANSRKGADYTPPKKDKAGPKDETGSLDAKALSDLEAARKELTAAIKADAVALRNHTEAATIQGRLREQLADNAAVEEAANADITAELDEKLAKIGEQEAKVRAAKVDAHTQAQLATLEEARQTLQAAAVRKRITAEDERAWADEKAARDALVATIEQAYAQQGKIIDYQLAVDRIREGYVQSSDAKRAADLKTLSDQKLKDDQDRNRSYALQAAAVPKEAPDRDTKLASLAAQKDLDQSLADSLYAQNKVRTLYDDVGPLQKWTREATMDAGKVGDALQSEVVKGLDDFNEGVASAIANGESLGDVMASVFKSMEADLIRYLLKQAEIGVLGNQASGATGILSSIASLFGGSSTVSSAASASLNLAGSASFTAGLTAGLPHFDTGGSFQVGGSGGMDGNLVPLMLSKGERVDISRADQMRDMSAMPITYAPVYNVQGYGQDIDALKAQMAQDQASFAGRVEQAAQAGLSAGRLRPARA